MRKSQRSSHGTATSTRHTRLQSKVKRTSSKTEKISRFFKNIDNEDKSTHNQSLYQDAITEIGEVQMSTSKVCDGDADFVSPKSANKLARIFTKVKEANIRGATHGTSRAKKKFVIGEERVLMHIGKTSDINVEHLQLAMALSKSLEPELCAVQEEEEKVFPSTQQIAENARLELDGYRLGTGRNKLSQKLIFDSNFKSSTRKKSKFRYVKPKLFTVTNEDRERLHQEKVTQILSHTLECRRIRQKVEHVVHSFILQEHVCASRRVFNISQQVNKDIGVYYVEALRLDKPEATCGYFLKNWDLIAGRQKSPERKQIMESSKKEIEVSGINISENVSDTPQVQEHERNKSLSLTSQTTFCTARSCSSYISSVSQASRKMIRSVSPDLFASSDEELFEEDVFTSFASVTSGNKQYEAQHSKNTPTVNTLFGFKDGGDSPMRENLKQPEDKCEDQHETCKDSGIAKDCLEDNASPLLLSNINAFKLQNSRKNSTKSMEITLSKLNEPQTSLAVDDKRAFHSTLHKNNKLKDFASVSLLSNLNAARDVEIFYDSDPNVEVDDKGICTYENFCDYDDNFVRAANSTEPEENLNISTGSTSETMDATGVQTNKETNEILLHLDGATVTNNGSKMNISASISNTSYINDSFASEKDKSFATMNVTHHVKALLNSETFVDAFKSICIEKYFKSNQMRDKNFDTDGEKQNNLFEKISDKQKEYETTRLAKEKNQNGLHHERNDPNFIDLSQDVIDSDSDDCIDLSQDSDHTDSVDQLNDNLPKKKKNTIFQRHLSSKSMGSSISSNESICISDEELNYSCLNATPKPTKPLLPRKNKKPAYNKKKFTISDSEDDEDFDKKIKKVGGEKMDMSINVTKLLAALQGRKRKETDNQIHELTDLTDKSVEAVLEVDDNDSSSDYEDENDHDLQKALKLSRLEAINDEKKRLSQEDRNKTQKTNDTVGYLHQNDENHELDGDVFQLVQNEDANKTVAKPQILDSCTITKTERNEEQDGDSAKLKQNGVADAGDVFGDSFPSISCDFDEYCPTEVGVKAQHHGNFGESKAGAVEKNGIQNGDNGDALQLVENGDFEVGEDFGESSSWFNKVFDSNEDKNKQFTLRPDENKDLRAGNISTCQIASISMETSDDEIEINNKTIENECKHGHLSFVGEKAFNGNRTEKQYGEDADASKLHQNDKVTNEFSDGFSSRNNDLDSNENNFNHSFPSFDHENLDPCEPNFTVLKNITMKVDNKLEVPHLSEGKTNENEFDEFDLLVDSNKSVFKQSFNKATKPQYRRIQELIGANARHAPANNPWHQTSIIRTNALFEDTFANLLEQTNVIQNLERIEHEVQGSAGNIDEKLKTPLGIKVTDVSRLPTGSPTTPSDGLYVKTVNVTPMPMYDAMTTPEIHQELDKIGVKRMKRRRGVQMLMHVYNSMHLQLQKQAVHQDGDNVEKVEVDLDETNRPNKRRKRLSYEFQNSGDSQIADGVRRDATNIQPFIRKAYQTEDIEINPKLFECEALEDLIFERKQSKRIKSCALPFHIAWHNFLCANRDIWENVLLYEPLQVEVLYAMFKDLGFKYHIQDMIAFFDKKCITIRIKQNN